MGAKQKYNVIIYERLRTNVCIEAASAAEALHIAEEA